MKRGKQDVYFAFPAYGGNGGVSMMSPNIMEWFVGVMLKAKADPRIGEIYEKVYSDTPITMMRNRMVVDARAAKADILVMVDSDMYPDIHLGQDPYAKAWWDTTLDFVLGHMDKGPAVVAAPYCGPPPGECVYAFTWTNQSSTGAYCDISLTKYTRDHAVMLAGIQPAAAVATGLIMYDMRAFDLTEPSKEDRGRKANGWFYYEYSDHYAQEKASTEDVTATRDISTAGERMLGYNPVFVNWDAWAGHWKPYPVPKPVIPTIDMVGDVFERAIRSGRQSLSDHMHYIGTGAKPGPGEVVFGNRPQDPGEAQGILDRYSCMYSDTFSHSELTNMLNQKHGFGTEMKVVEVGTFLGDMTKRICAWCLGAKVWCVDPWKGDYDGNDVVSEVYKGYSADGVYDAFMLNTKPYADRVTPMRMTSLEAAEKFDDNSLDLVYIDGDHTGPAVEADIKAWLPKVKPGGILAGDDYGRCHCPEVKGAVDRMLGGHSPHGPVKTATYMWYVEKQPVGVNGHTNGHVPVKQKPKRPEPKTRNRIKQKV